MLWARYLIQPLVSKGWLNRAHAYKAAVDANTAAGKNPDDNINTGLYNYPVLMAADILLYGTQVVPIGLDRTMARGAENARAISTPFMEEIRRKVGVR